jgi:translocation and assembly module TamB
MWRLVLTPLRWSGNGRKTTLEGEIDWPRQGNLACTIRSLDSSMWGDFVRLPASDIQIQALDFRGNWNAGPARSTLECSGAIAEEGLVLPIEVHAAADGKGVALERLTVASPTQPIFSANGFIPLTIVPGQPGHWINLLPKEILKLSASSETNSLFWNRLSKLSGILLEEPRLGLEVSGQWDSLQGTVRMEAKRIKLPGKRWGILAPRDLRLSLELTEDIARVTDLTFLLEGHPVVLGGEVPLGKSFWARLLERKPEVDWNKASARLSMLKAPISQFATLWPNVLGREGSFDLGVTVRPGLKPDGEMKVLGASTVPLGSFGVVRDINASLKLQGQTVELMGVTASVGAAPVSAEGKLDLAGGELFRGLLPPFEVAVRGLNVPLAREPDLIIRSDLDVTVSKARTGPAVIRGKVELRESFFLRDLEDLLPGGVATPSQRPPYFSVEEEPWADWRLDLNLRGDRVLKVNSPLFRGLISTDLKLTGTLKNPVALGNVKIDSGLVQFPFANLEVTQGFVTLTSDNPYRPQLLITAGSRNAGYDVKMQVTGPADQPLVQFSSTPPLSSEQIVLMLTAGVLPRSEYALSMEQRAGRVVMFLGKNLLSQIGLAGEGDRVTIRTGEEISETGRPTYHVEYKLTNRWYLVGEYDQFNAFNVGLRWKIYSK